jgi:hypothetical protein
LNGKLPPLEAALAIKAFAFGDHPAAADIPFDTLAAVESETDAIPLGERRDLWHPDVRVAEDRKHDQAQEWARPLVERACRQLLDAIPAG